MFEVPDSGGVVVDVVEFGVSFDPCVRFDGMIDVVDLVAVEVEVVGESFDAVEVGASFDAVEVDVEIGVSDTVDVSDVGFEIDESDNADVSDDVFVLVIVSLFRFSSYSCTILINIGVDMEFAISIS